MRKLNRRRCIALVLSSFILGSVLTDPFVAPMDVWADDAIDEEAYSLEELDVPLDEGVVTEEVEIDEDEAEALFVEQTIDLYGEEAVMDALDVSEEKLDVYISSYESDVSKQTEDETIIDEGAIDILTSLYESHTASNSDFDKYANDYLYNRMNAEQKKIYDQLYNGCANYLYGDNKASDIALKENGYYPVATANYNTSVLSRSGAVSVSQVFNFMNPQFYFLNGVYGWASNGVIELYIYPDFANGASRASCTSNFKSKVDALISQINTCSTEREKAKKAHDLICKDVKYDKNYNNQYKASKYDQGAYGALMESYTVCAGYAEAFELLCNAVGITTLAVTSEGHEWNEISIDGTWYLVDVTWDDLDSGTPGYRDTFFCVTADFVRANDQVFTIGQYTGITGQVIVGHKVYGHHLEDCWSNITATLPINYISPVYTAPQTPTKTTTTPTTTSTPTVTKLPMYRMCNLKTAEHFYTQSATERDHLTKYGWRYEGIGWYSPTSGSPVYRMCNLTTAEHFYTQSATERDHLTRYGWRYEGIAFRIGGNVPTYRMCNLKTAEHFYTQSITERNHLMKYGWRYEGVAWYSY